MMKVLALAGLSAALIAVSASAQMHGQPYSTFKDRPIKALSAEEVANLRAGRGMGMALPAELNRYPGPMHALEHDAALGLTSQQKQDLVEQMSGMRRAAVPLGERIIALEIDLETLFRSGNAEAAGIDRLTAEIGALYGELRAVHLRTHLATRATLSDTQLAAYQRARGYDVSAPTDHPRRH